jgi:DNA-binding transcriptional LysR family regulator
LWDEPFIAAPAETGWWRDYWLATGERQGHPARIGAVTNQPDTWLTAIANGDGIAVAPESAARYYARPGITYRPVTGVSPSQVGVAWAPANDPTPSSRTSCAAAWTAGRSADLSQPARAERPWAMEVVAAQKR